jgi:hypothetical protein
MESLYYIEEFREILYNNLETQDKFTLENDPGIVYHKQL